MRALPVLLLLGTVRSGLGFNVDTRFPLVKQAGISGGMFGFSVSLHQQTEGESRYLLLSGAPQDSAPVGVKANRTGALYACPITDSATDCFRISIDPESDPSKNIIENMWLGVTVESQRDGGRVLVCAHRYTAVQWSGNEDQRRMIGRCYVRGNDLEFNDEDDWQSYHNELCNSNKDHELTGMCQLGMSGGFTKNMVYFGAPGAYNWQGTDFILQRDTNWDMKEFSYPSNKQYNTYMGYSVQISTGVLHQDQVTVVSGAPRWDHRGAVFLLEIQGDALEVRTFLTSEQVGSYFGSAIALVDVNNDGLQDIAVGAPYYFDRKEEVGGSVYIYTNEAGYFKNESSLVLRGPSASGFGFALANIGDINQDGFTDLAVGAPFEDSGKVYIYLSKANGLQNKPYQVIDGAQAGSVSTFGYSLSGGLDVDENSYPDILVGSLTDRIVLLRSRPVINISKSFKVTPSLVDPSKCSSTQCMTVEICFSYLLSTGNRNVQRQIMLEYTLEADYDRRPYRAKFFNSSNVHKDTFLMPDIKCKTIKLLLLDNIRDKLHPIQLSLNYSIVEKMQTSPSAVQSLDNYPILNPEQSTTEVLEIHIKKECGSDNVCRSNLQLQYEYLGPNQEVLPRVNGTQVLYYDSDLKFLNLKVTVTNYPSPTSAADDAHEASLNVSIPTGFLIYSVKPVCDLFDTVSCDIGNPFKRGQMMEINIKFEVQSISLKTREVVASLQLSTLSKQTDLEPKYAYLLIDYTLKTAFSVSPPNVQTYFSGEVMGESAMKTVEDVGNPVEFSFLVLNSGEPLESLGTLLVVVTWPYEVSNGKWLIYPTEVLVISEDDKKQCNPPGDIIDPLNLMHSNKSESGGRRRREVEEIPDVKTLASIKTERSMLTLRCAGGGANCVQFTCPIKNLTKTATVTVRGRVWNSTFLEDYRNVDRVRVEGAAELHLQTDIPTIRMESRSVMFSVSIDSLLVEPPQAEIPLWLIIVSVGSGILLLGIIILLLWKCGFFRRANTRAMYEVRGQKAEMKMQPSEAERLTRELDL
ncbi:integrin alpha-3 [Pelobates cultripes]|uniref:Integrin alpha-3 n=1 Tax=Pelobates cultripes TaxID=61616 RepID=A0AAD1SL62_PELCU|nr:integrin alpha-3 [Pelobates cultripes]